MARLKQMGAYMFEAVELSIAGRHRGFTAQNSELPNFEALQKDQKLLEYAAGNLELTHRISSHC